MAISKKIRFNIFKRDSFTCQYCGKTPPSAILEIDHILPRSKQGSDDYDNLVTACFDCNRGKSNGLLSDIPQSLKDKADVLKEKELQLKEYNKLLKGIRSRQNKDVSEVENTFNDYFTNSSFTDTFRDSIRINFLPYINKYDLSNYMVKSCTKCPNNPEAAIKYFCGICWSVRRENEGA